MNGTIWKFENQRGIEVGRNDFRLQLSVINDHWPFPSEPIWVDRCICEKEQEPSEVWRQNNEFNHVFIRNGEAPL